MARLLQVLGMPLRRLFFARLPFSPPRFGHVLAFLSILGIACIGYLYGAAVMYFQLPSSNYLEKAFDGAQAWRQRGRSTIPELPAEAVAAAKKREGLAVDKPAKTCDGFTLYVMNDAARATLIDMRGTVVHRWQLPFSRAWSDPPHIDDPLADQQVHWFHCYLYPNGDLLAVYHADGDTPYGYGLVKLDKDSRLLWAYAGRVHHALDVGDDGTIYTLTQELVDQPQPGLDYLPVPYLADSLVVLSPEGREREALPLADAFAHSPYAPLVRLHNRFSDTMNLFRTTEAPPATRPAPAPLPADQKNDVFHANSVRVLSRSREAQFPLFQAGQVLVSLRNMDTIAVVDLATRRVAWAAQGVWRLQHDAEFLDNGHLLLYDNAGSLNESRILEYDPRTQAIPWVYRSDGATPFHALHRGMKQRLPNGNTFIVDPEARRLFEVTRDKELVWECFCPLPAVTSDRRPRNYAINSARRYGKNQLTFLEGGARARP